MHAKDNPEPVNAYKLDLIFFCCFKKSLTSFNASGLLPIVFGLSSRPQGHGYTVISVKRKNPFFEMGTEIKGHEFHYSHILEWKGDPNDLAFDMRRGTGFIDNQDGICYKNILATYTHIHALGTPSWAQAMIRNAQQYRDQESA